MSSLKGDFNELLERSGVETTNVASTDALASELLAAVRNGDVVVTMSSGSFDGLPHRLLDALARSA